MLARQNAFRPTPLLAFMWLVLWLAPASAQDESPGESTARPGTDWVVPEITALPIDWWSRLASASPVETLSRAQQLLSTIASQIDTLAPEDQPAARNKLENLRNLIALLGTTYQDESSEDYQPLPTLDVYELDDVLMLRGRWRSLRKSQSRLTLDLDQAEREIELMVQRRGDLRERYEAAPALSPERLRAGLDSVAARVEWQIALNNQNKIRALLAQARVQREKVDAQLSYALENLSTSPVSEPETLAALQSARQHNLDMQERVTASQKRLVEALSAESANSSLRQLRRQQLARSNAEAALAGLLEALAENRTRWHEIHLPDGEWSEEVAYSTLGSKELIAQTLEASEVWTAASQATLASNAEGDSANAAANLDLARSVARDTLKLVDQMQDVGDDLELVQDILDQHSLASKSGLSKIWASVSLAFGSTTASFDTLLNFRLFDIGDAPVTPGGIVKMIVILALAFLASLLLRRLFGKLSSRVSARLQFNESPVIYSLGRVLHYVIIVIGVLVALGSIGMDFTNFALIAGALSVGIGFGLQGVVNNFVSGLILLFEGSLRVGDFIELDSGFQGIVKEINTRATIVNTNDSVDVVVPNSELTTTKLTNWTLREPIARMRIPFGVAYGSDKEKVKEAALAAAAEMEFVILNMPGREPQIRLLEFGDSSLNFELRAWVGRQGVRRPVRTRSSFLWALDTHLRETGIEVPFPQRDVHVKNDSPPVPLPPSAD